MRPWVLAFFPAVPVLVLSLASACSEDILPPATSADGAAPASGTDVRFIAVGDTGKGNAGQQKVAAGMKQKCDAERCDFVVLLGDNIYESGISSPDDPQMQTKFEQVYAALEMDFQIVLGNHDYGAEGLGTDFGKAKHEIDYTARSTKWKLPAPHYQFQKLNVDFFALDTNLMMFGRDAQQKTDVAGWIAASAAPWKIALGHHPYISNGPHGNAGVYDRLAPPEQYAGAGVKTFMDSVVCGKVDLYLSSHDHSMQWPAATCQGTALAVSGAGAQPTLLPGQNPMKFQENVLGFLYIVVTKTTLTAQFVTDTGVTLHEEKLSK